MADLSFGIENTSDLFHLLLEEYEDFKQDKLSSKFAIRCAMTSWHLVDWCYKEFHVSLAATYPRFDDYRTWVKSQCLELGIMQDIANGSKHNQISLYQPKVDKTEIHKGAFSNAFSRGFDISSLDVHMKDGTKLYFEDLIEPVINFWRNHFSNDIGMRV